MQSTTEKVSIPQAVSTVATYSGSINPNPFGSVSIPQAVSAVATGDSNVVTLHVPAMVSIPQAVSTVAT